MKVGKDVILSDNITIKRKENCSIGNHVAIDYGFYCTTKMEIGDYVHISPYVTCIGGKDGQFIAKGFNNIMAGVRIVCGSDRFDGSGLFGANAIVLAGSTLRRGVLVTAGSLLIGDTEEWGVYKGNPAKIVSKIDGSKIIENAKQLGYNET